MQGNGPGIPCWHEEYRGLVSPAEEYYKIQNYTDLIIRP